MTRVGGPPVAGRYELIEDFGPDERFAGGRVRTWQARDLQAKRPVVLRLISPGGASARLLLDRALELSLLAHPALGMIHDAVDHGGYGIVVGEWVPGVPLADLLDVEGALEPPKVRDLIGGIAEAVADAHHAGLPIGGLRTERVVVRADGSGALVGAPALFADERGDIAGLGELLYTALTGNSIGPDQPDPRSAMHRGIPRELAALALRAMDSDPTRQLATAAAFATVLRPRSRPVTREPAAAAERTTRRLLGPDADAAGQLPGAGLEPVTGGAQGSTGASAGTAAADTQPSGSSSPTPQTPGRSDTAPTPSVAPGSAAAGTAGLGTTLAAGAGATGAAGLGAGAGAGATGAAGLGAGAGAGATGAAGLGAGAGAGAGAAAGVGSPDADSALSTPGGAGAARRAEAARDSAPGTDPYGPQAPTGFADGSGTEIATHDDWLVSGADPGTERGARGVRGWFDRGRSALSRDGSDRDGADDWDSYDDWDDADDGDPTADRNDLPLGWSSDIWEGDEEWDDGTDNDAADDGPPDGTDGAPDGTGAPPDDGPPDGTGAPPDASDRSRSRTAAGIGGAALVGSLFGRAGRRAGGGREGRGGSAQDSRIDAAEPNGDRSDDRGSDRAGDRGSDPNDHPDTEPVGQPAAPPGSRLRAESRPVPAGPPPQGPEPTAPIPTAPAATAPARATPVPTAPVPARAEPSAAERAARRRRVLMLAVPALALILVIALAVFIGGRIGSDGDGGEEVADASTTAAPTSSVEPTTAAPAPPAPGPLAPISATVYNPFGDGEPENEDDVGLSYDGDPATGWSTVTYQGSPEFGNLKPGVGLLYDLGAERSITAVELATSLPGSALEIRVGGTPDAALDGYPVVAIVDPLGPTASVALAEPATARFVLVWFVRLTDDDGGFSATLSECRILGT